MSKATHLCALVGGQSARRIHPADNRCVGTVVAGYPLCVGCQIIENGTGTQTVQTGLNSGNRSGNTGIYMKSAKTNDQMPGIILLLVVQFSKLQKREKTK